MLSKSQISLVKSLHQKKYRKEEQLFIVEGLKSIFEFLNSPYVLHTIYATSDIFPKLANLSHKQKKIEVSDNDLLKISTLQHPQGIVAIFEIPKNKYFNHMEIDEMTIVLDGIQDPGNLGTIIRTADWFGFKHIICSENTVEVSNPKVVQAT
ncbi:MAG: RNA methyltransferase, partial [Bacteroidetes bacterium]|nr:RNA methyltransferase [Bacteroidota bacterium]